MRHATGNVTTSDGLRLYAEIWLPDGQPKGMLTYSHGIGEYLGRYGYLAEKLASAGYGFAMVDLRGHGRSPGKRGHIMHFEDYHRDFAAGQQVGREVAPGVAQFFGGHSLGGLIALNLAVENPDGYRGVIASGPGLRLGFEPPAWKVSLGRVLSNVTPGLMMTSELDVSNLSHDRAIVDAYVADPLVHDHVSTRWYTEFVAAQETTMARAPALKLPLLLMQGAEDRLVSVAATCEFYEAAGSADKTLKVYEGLYHEVFNELERDRVIADLIAWLDVHNS